MKPNTIIITLVAGFAVVGLLVWGYAKSGNTAASVSTAGPSMSMVALAATETVHDFGTISMKDGNVSHDFVFTNPTTQDITIRGLETSCMCTSALLVEPDGSTKGPFGMAGMGGLTTADETIKAGASRTLRVIYDPKAHGPTGVGSIDRFITITDASGSTLRFEIKALVTP